MFIARTARKGVPLTRVDFICPLKPLLFRVIVLQDHKVNCTVNGVNATVSHRV